MPKSGSIFNKILGKGKAPLNVQRVVISDTLKHNGDESRQDRSVNFEPFDISDMHEENLEDTPSVAVHFERPAKQESKHSVKPAKQPGKHSKKKQKSIVFADKLPVNANGHDAQKRFKNKQGFGSKLTSLFIKESQTSNNAALEFAENKRRVGRKGRRNRKIAIYAGTSIIVIVLMLVIVLVPGGSAAPADAGKQSPGAAVSTQSVAFTENQTDELTPDVTVSDDAVDTEGVTSDEPSETPIITGSPDGAETPQQTAITTTPPDKTLPPINVDKEVQSFKVEAKLYYNDMGYSSNYYKYTDEELYMLAQVIHAEARGEGTEGMIAVGNVVMNRVISRGFPGNTIKDVVTRPGQFAYNPNTRPGVASKIAARQVLDFQVWVIPQNIYFFKVSSSKSNWGSHKYEFNIGAHAFYSDNYSGRFRGDSIPPALYERTYKWPTLGCKREDRVYKLQYMLNKLGYNVKADKYFGQDTKDAIIEFQNKKGLKDDGVAGPATLKALIYEFGLQNYYQKFCT